MRSFLAAAALAGLSSVSFAQQAAEPAPRVLEEITLSLEGPVDRQSVTYACRASEDAEPNRITVDYINLPHSNLAIVPVDGHPTLFASVVSASGARYVSGAKVWWTRGPRGDLYDETQGGIAGSILCRVERG
ncbi:MliC family protein [Fulvimarina sp. 2208YS6-2-32]|uniref:MliC family protein n=1 Tax=Fulvimarina uroteuthidis TaxID=3098149 RepID=A0ABU5I1C0_9HYPH|nr:MliC family protein [Fulvimarina sp. 2208YS6-2-32]MDY8109016.1 MliC family protein [Fulvimarina sp. 2208YS6-2-32]